MRYAGARRFAVVVIVLGMLGAGALLLPRSPLSGDRGASRLVVPDLPPFFDVLLLVAAFAIVTGVAILVLAVSAGMNPEQVRRRRGSLGAVVLLLLAALTFVLFSSRDGSSQRELGGRDRRPAVATPGPAEPAPSEESSRGLGWLLVAVVAVAVVGGSVAVWRTARRQIPESVHEEELERRVLAGLDAAIRDLEGIEDPRAAVIACYGRLRDLAAAGGISVKPSDTALELLETLVANVPALAPPSQRLVALFQEARFSPHAIDADMRRIALEALEEARDRLGDRV